MLNPLHHMETQSAALAAAPSLAGNAVQLADQLVKLSGGDMRQLALNIPFETAEAARLIRETLHAVLVLLSLRQQSEHGEGL